jgi:hypothetical protein
MRSDTPAAAALRYAERGWHVLPCHHITATGCSCRRTDCSSPGKHPRTASGLREATASPAQVRQWWRRWTGANVGIRTGEQSGLVVLDVDPDHGGVDSLRSLIAQHGRLPPGLRVRTGSGGWHLYFAHPGDSIPNSAGRLGPGLDVRGDGGYVITPPSNHRSGGTYVFNDEAAPLPDMPDWLLRSVRQQPAPRRDAEPIRIGEAIDAWVQAAIAGEAARVRAAPEGARNATLNRAAFSLGQIAAAGLVDGDTIRSALSNSALAVGLAAREIEATIRSGVAAGARSPRVPVQTQPLLVQEP